MKYNLGTALAVAAVGVVFAATSWVVRRHHKPGQLDVVTAQAMDMSQMRPPAGAAPVELASIQIGEADNSITYTATVLPFNQQDVASRIAGTVLSLPVYPGDTVRAGETVAQLDNAELAAKAAEAVQQERAAGVNARVALLTHHLHHRAAISQASAQYAAAVAGLSDAESASESAQSGIQDSQARVQGARASADYWKTEIAREKTLADAGAASRQEYQSEQAQAQAAFAAVSQAMAEAAQSKAAYASSRAKVAAAKRIVDAAGAAQQMAQADLVVAAAQAEQAQAGAAASRDAVREAFVVQDYARIVSPQAGVVVSRPVSAGTLVQPGSTIVTVADIDHVRVQAHVASADLSGVTPGSIVTVMNQDGTLQSRAHVTSIFPSANAESHTATVEAVVANPGHRWMPGAAVTMRIGRPVGVPRLLVPASAIVDQGGQQVVWVAQGTGRPAPRTYECSICHMHYSAADAARFHGKDPMDGGTLTLIPAMRASATLTAHAVPVRISTSDGSLVSVASAELSAGERVVSRGGAGLTEGTRLVETTWNAAGPAAVSTAAARGGAALYRCETCGMTYSEADARRNHYKDPMDGGTLTRVKEPTQ